MKTMLKIKVNIESDDSDYSRNVTNECALGLNVVNANIVKPNMILLQVEDKTIDMEIDTGASMSTISEKKYMILCMQMFLCVSQM